MFGPSLKSVPGCLVSMVPMLIGVPVAATPDFGPHEDVLVEVAAVVALAVELVALEPPALLVALLLLLLLPHAASTRAPTSAASATPARRRSAWWITLTLVLLLWRFGRPRPRLGEGAILLSNISVCKIDSGSPNETEKNVCSSPHRSLLHTASSAAILGPSRWSIRSTGRR